MDFDKLFEDMAFAQAESYGAQLKTRSQRQRDIEDAIMRFSPEYDEAQDIMDALMASLERSYENELLDANECVTWWKEALSKQEAKLVRKPDEMDLARWGKTK
jgi:hypothetical protein